MTGAAHHPYTRGAGRPPSDRGGTNDITIASLGRLDLWLDRGARAGGLPSRCRSSSTEYGFQTNPPDRSAGVSHSGPGQYLNQSDYMAWTNSRLRSTAQYELYDERDLGAFQTGLRFADGRAKPGHDAYRLPVWAFPKRGYTLRLGHGAPGRGDAAQVARSSTTTPRRAAWKKVRTVSVSGQNRFVYLRTRARGKYFRIVAGDQVEPQGAPKARRRARRDLVRARLAGVDLEPHVGRPLVGAPAVRELLDQVQAPAADARQVAVALDGVKPTPWSTISVRMRSGSFVISSRTGPSPPYFTLFVISSDTSRVMSGSTCSGRLGSSWVSAVSGLCRSFERPREARGCKS